MLSGPAAAGSCPAAGTRRGDVDVKRWPAPAAAGTTRRLAFRRRCQAHARRQRRGLSLVSTTTTTTTALGLVGQVRAGEPCPSHRARSHGYIVHRPGRGVDGGQYHRHAHPGSRRSCNRVAHRELARTRVLTSPWRRRPRRCRTLAFPARVRLSRWLDDGYNRIGLHWTVSERARPSRCIAFHRRRRVTTAHPGRVPSPPPSASVVLLRCSPTS